MSRNRGCICSVFGCNNRGANRRDSSTGDQSLMFHRFPKPSDSSSVERLKRWVIYCRRSDLDKLDCTTFWKSRVVCSKHFEDSMYYNPKDRFTSRLLPKAAPTVAFSYSITSTKRWARTKRERETDPIHDLPSDDPPASKKVKIEPSDDPPASKEVKVEQRVNENDSAPSKEKSFEMDTENLPTLQTHEACKRQTHKCSWRNRYSKQRLKAWKLSGVINRLKKQIETLTERKERYLKNAFNNQ